MCWLPENNVLAATTEGIFKVDFGPSKIYKLDHSKEKISSMVLCKSGLFIGYKTGYIDVINITGSRWSELGTINIDQPIEHLFTSPDHNFIVGVTVKGVVCYSDTNNANLNFKKIYLSECGGEVGIGFIGPYSHICATCRKNGCVNMFLTSDGRHLTTFQIDEEIMSMATSPVCSCIVVGTRGGFIYFIDVTDILKPKIVHCERPFDTPVSHLKFDNFGYFLVASASSKAVKIWSGLPSSKFEFLGSKRISTEVTDILAFSRSEADETVILLLSEFKSASIKESENVLIRLQLPLDFRFDAKKYQIDMFGTLDGDALKFQKRRFEEIFPKIIIHSTLGAILYFPDSQKVQSCQVWSEFTNQKLEDIISAINMNYIYISPDELWIAILDLYGGIRIYSCKDFTLSASSKKYCSSESKCNSFIVFPLFSNHLIYCRENGVLIFYEWMENSTILQKVPEWVVHCLLQSREENILLKSSEAEEKLIVNFIETEITESGIFPDIYKNFQIHNAWAHTIHFMLDKILDDSADLDDKSIPSNFVFDAKLLENIVRKNREKLSLLISPKTQKTEEDLKMLPKEEINKVLSSFSIGLITQNFCEEILGNDDSMAESLNNVSDELPNTTSQPNLSFNRTVKRKSKQEIRETMKVLIKGVCKLKTEFNSEFNQLFSAKPEVSERLSAAYSEAKLSLQTLPSKAERDFWGAYLEEKESGRLASNIEKKSTINESDVISEDLDIKRSKSLIESSLTSAQEIQDEFDSKMQTLILKKKFCDYKIFKSEIKIYSLLLLIEVDDSFSNLNLETEKTIKHLGRLVDDVQEFMKDILDLENNMKDFNAYILRKERHYSFKAETKCQKMNSVKIIELFRTQPALQLDEVSQNPFWPSNPKSIKTIDLESIVEGFQIKKSRPDNIQNTEWEHFCNDKIRIFKFGVIIRNLKDQAVFLSNKKQFCAEADSKIISTKNILQKSVNCVSLLISKIKMNFHTLLISFEKEKLVYDSKQELELQSIGKHPKSDDQLSRDISNETFILQKVLLLLDEMEQNFQRLCEQNYEMRLKCIDILEEKQNALQECTEKFDDCKQNFADTKAMGEELIESSKKSVFKNLKSHFSFELPSKEKLANKSS